MGKLVPQDSNDEPASELLKKIAAEKAQLIKEGKIKKEKLLPEITDEEKPFELPSGWEFVRLQSIANVMAGNAFSSEDFSSEAGARVIKITNAGVGEFVETSDYLPFDFINTASQYLVSEGDFILALTRPYIADGLKISKCPASYNNSLLNQRVAAIKINPLMESEYFYQYFKSHFVLGVYLNRFGGSGLQPNLKMSDVTELIFAVPPKEEQHRIVAKVDELMTLCDTLKTNLQNAQTTQLALADALVEQAVG
jgi:type I restriction enzyme S subunit